MSSLTQIFFAQAHRLSIEHHALIMRYSEQFDHALKASSLSNTFSDPTTLFALNNHQVDDFVGALWRAWIASDFIAQFSIRSIEEFTALVRESRLDEPPSKERLQQELQNNCADVASDEALMQVLRRFRNQEMCRIAWRDINNLASLEETLQAISTIADLCVEIAYLKIETWQQEAFGKPLDNEDNPLSLITLAMGKWGGQELNFSSDIDLIFAFPANGETQGGQRIMANETFFTRLAQRLIKVIDTHTADGFVFRVDARLRPYGDSGPIVMSINAMELYYQSQARDWERYAMIKARPITGQRHHRQALMAMLKPFIFRRYLDFNIIESLRRMKQNVVDDMKRKGLKQHVKLGQGGIREIEFVTQSFQLIHGGRKTELQMRSLLPALKQIRQLDLLPAYVVHDLTHAYRFLRKLENHLQYYADKQTHLLPTDPYIQARMAFGLGYPNWQACLADYQNTTHKVQRHFELISAAPQIESQAANSSEDTPYRTLWIHLDQPERCQKILEKLGWPSASDLYDLLCQFKHSSPYRRLSAKGLEVIEQLISQALSQITPSSNNLALVERLLHFFESIAGRTTYLSLLSEHPLALSQMIQLMRASPWISEQLCRYPILLDELLDPRSLYAPDDQQHMQSELSHCLNTIADEDLERQMDALRQFKLSHTLRVAATDVMDKLPLMRVSDYLTATAEVLLQSVLKIVWSELTKRHGTPLHHESDFGLIIVGYGKLGGIELGYQSDLDLVFLCHDDAISGVTTGPKVIEASVFYQRLVQRFLHLCNTRTSAGILYEIDTRLRPSGRSGLLITTLSGFERYQQESAWTWEHQALVRSRPIAGDTTLQEAFLRIRRERLCQARNISVLKKEVQDMRLKMAEQVKDLPTDRFHIKLSPGGITDIEFIVQYLILAHAHQHPDLVAFSDNIRQCDALEAAQILSHADADFLRETYKKYRSRLHRLVLQHVNDSTLCHETFADDIKGVKDLWHAVIGEAS